MTRTLVATVGTGDARAVEATLFAPLLRSMADGPFGRIVLLPSAETANLAEALAARHTDPGACAIRPLPAPGMAEDVDACFGHFDAVLADLLAEGADPNAIVTDFTRGTKGMAAALVLAAVRRGISTLRYVTSPQRDARGIAIAGTECPVDIRAATIAARRQLDLAENLLRHGDFAAVLTVLPDLDTPFASLLAGGIGADILAARRLAALLGAWDRLDYPGAARLVSQKPLPAWRGMTVSDDQALFLQTLSRVPEERIGPIRADYLRALAADLAANAARRVDQGAFEDAVIRAYRVTEMIVQARLADHSINHEAVRVHDGPAAGFLARRRQAGRGIGDAAAASIRIGLEDGVALLASLDDPVTPGLQRVLSTADPLGKRFQAMRNQSVLIHGAGPGTAPEPTWLDTVIDRLAALVLEDDPDNAARRLDLAQFDAGWRRRAPS